MNPDLKDPEKIISKAKEHLKSLLQERQGREGFVHARDARIPSEISGGIYVLGDLKLSIEAQQVALAKRTQELRKMLSEIERVSADLQEELLISLLLIPPTMPVISE